ncbi:MAG: hypothetical protein ACX931_10905 [Saccharospirillum sp.]
MSLDTRADNPNRQHYLEAMGITPWYPRVVLPYAPKPLALVPDNAGVPEPPIPAPVTPGTTARPEAPVIARAPAEPAPEVAAARKASPVPRFGLGLSVVGPLLIADSLPRGHEQGQAATQTLLWNILAVLGQSEAALRTQHIVQWPLFTNPRVDQGMDQARIYVDEKLEQFQRQFGPRWLLSFGGVMPRLHQWQQPQGEHQGLRWVALPALQKMLTAPEQKAVAWRRLKPLLAQLS